MALSNDFLIGTETGDVVFVPFNAWNDQNSYVTHEHVGNCVTSICISFHRGFIGFGDGSVKIFNMTDRSIMSEI
jgi:hypothetical protein